MAIQTINLGNYANDGTGDDLRVAFTKVNANFAELNASAAIANGVNVGSGIGIFFAKDTTNLQFKSLTSTNSSVTISSTGNTVNLAAITNLQSDLAPTLGANLNLNNKYVYGGDIQSTVYGYNIPISTMFNSLLVESNNLNVDMGAFLTPTGYETDGLAGKKGYLLDWGLFSDTPVNDKLNFGSFSDHLTGGIGQLTLAGNLVTTGAYNLTLATTANTSLTLPTSGTLTTTANNLSAFAATTSAQLAGVISDETGTGSLVFSTNPTLSGVSLTNSATVSGGSLTFSGPISAPAWTTTGIRHISIPTTLTDTTSTGTVANAYTNNFGGNTIAATNATTYTNYSTAYINIPVAGTNVTITNAWSIITEGNILLRGNKIDGPSSTTAFPSATSLSIGATAAAATVTVGGANAGNILKIAGTAASTTTAITTDVTSGTFQMLQSVTGQINIGASGIIQLGTSTSATTTAQVGGAFTGNTLKVAGTAAGTINLTTDVTTGIVNIFTGTTGTVNLGGTGALVTNSGYYIHSINATVSAAGNAVQATATPLIKDVNILTTVTSGSATGVALPAGTAGMVIFVYNSTATAANVYPVSGGSASINALANNVAFSLAATTGARFVCASATKWYTI